MPRPLRVQFAGAIYHIISRGDRREQVFVSDADRLGFLRTLGEACAKTGWQVHAYCLMSNHFHLVLETPQPNLSVGMQWLLGTYTQRFNRVHRHWGHLFGGRYRAQLIDERSRGYLRCACDYVHLNPVRARMIKQAELRNYRWSSYPAYVLHKLRPGWLRADRLLGEYGLNKDTSSTRRQFGRAMLETQLDAADVESLRRGWKLGAEDFADRLATRLQRFRRKGEPARETRETDAALAERLVTEALAKVRWKEIDLLSQPKGHRTKVRIACELRSSTPMKREWIAQRLKMGSASYVSFLLADSQ
jgi:REP element-mobilizing transposase RayT